MTTAKVVDFQKYSALGNDYLVLAEQDVTTPMRGADVARLCDRRFGVGADGILLVGPQEQGQPFPLRIFNSDGSECERSGNGLRIFSQWLIDRGAVSGGSFQVRCLAGTSNVQVHPDGTISVEMGTADFGADAVGAADPGLNCPRYQLPTSAGALDATSLSVGNPHTVVFTEVDPATRRELGAEIAAHAFFRGGTNVQFVTATSADAITIEIWERGSGATLASGSSACAAVSAAHRRGVTGRDVTVRMPGGEITVDLRADGTIRQRGRAVRVFSGSVEYPPAAGLRAAGGTSGGIRFATVADAPRIAEIYNHAVTSRASTCDLEPQAVPAIESWFGGRDFTVRPIYVHTLDGTITGYLSVSNFWNDRPGYRVTADCGVYLDPAFQGKGIGSALLGHFLREAPGLGIANVTTSMFADNDASVRLFGKFGFQRVGLCPRVANIEDRWKDLAIVQRSVTP